MQAQKSWRAAANGLAVLVYLFLILPLLVVVLYSFSERSFLQFPPTGFSLRWYQAAWESGLFVEPALRSFGLALACTALATLLAVPAALAFRKLPEGRLRIVLEFLMLSPLIVPGLIVGIALLYAFNRVQMLDTFSALLAAHTVIAFPFMFRALLTSVLGLRQALTDASEILGASPAYTLRHVILPGLVPGIISGAIFSFIISLDQFTVSLFVTQSQQIVLPVAIYKYLFDVNDPVAAAVSTVLVVLGLLIAFVIDRLGWLRHLAGTGS
jgi:putative spermidine/putrescine transport system permease protein